jgi:hypothetical protein
MIDVNATINTISYDPILCKDLNTYSIEDFYSGKAFNDSSFRVNTEENNYAVSWWVSPKRTRSYPRARVYDTYDHDNRVTILPLVKDEGKDGDRDYLQWDTLSLMSLLQINVIIAPYKNADKNETYDNKITNQRFDRQYIKEKFQELQKYHSDALQWNLNQASNLDEVAELSKKYYYENISAATGVEMHSRSYFERRMNNITEKAEDFKQKSRGLAVEAQNRESLTLQPKESVKADKGRITIRDHLGGEYYFTTDEILVENNEVFLIEKKHTTRTFPSTADIKNGLVRMMLFKNLDTVKINGKRHEPVPVLGVTGSELEGYTSNSDSIADELQSVSNRKRKQINSLLQEANKNDFTVIISEDTESVEKELYERFKARRR